MQILLFDAARVSDAALVRPNLQEKCTPTQEAETTIVWRESIGENGSLGDLRKMLSPDPTGVQVGFLAAANHDYGTSIIMQIREVLPA